MGHGTGVAVKGERSMTDRSTDQRGTGTILPLQCAAIAITLYCMHLASARAVVDPADLQPDYSIQPISLFRMYYCVYVDDKRWSSRRAPYVYYARGENSK